MYSHQGRPGAAAAPKMANRYMKGRLPEGVDFAAYPGRSSTPLPTAESKSAERINQLKIWNEAATNDEKRRLNPSKGSAQGQTAATATRRTDSFKDAKDRHSASFHGSPPKASRRSGSMPNSDHLVSDAVAHPPSYHRTAVATVGDPPRQSKHADIYADRSDSDSDDDQDPPNLSPHPYNPADHPDPVPQNYPQHHAPPHVQPLPPVKPAPHVPSLSPPPATNLNASKTQPLPPGTPHPQPKESRACCTIM